jgi:hypothetical protein
MTDHPAALHELLPCPFCEGPAFVRGDEFASWVQCDRCFAEGPTVCREDSQPAAIAAWNKRTHGPEIARRVGGEWKAGDRVTWTNCYGDTFAGVVEHSRPVTYHLLLDDGCRVIAVGDEMTAPPAPSEVPHD